MMHVCLHDSFSVNYACVFCCSSDGEKGAKASLENKQNDSGTHILRLPPGRVVTFTNLTSTVSQTIKRIDNGDEPAIVEHPLLSPTPGVFLLLLFLDLGGL